MKALLLLAGRSRRFWPLTEKTLFSFCGTSLLEEQVQCLRRGGVKDKDIILVCGEHNLKQARKLFPDLKITKQEDLNLGMQGALLSALPSIKNESVLIVGGNDVIEPRALKDLRLAAGKPDVAGAILGKKVKEYFPGGYIVAKTGQAKAILEKPGKGNEPSDLVNIVAHIHNDTALLLSVLKKIDSKRDDGYERALTELMKKEIYRVVPYSGLWQPVKYPWHLLPLLTHFLSKLEKSRIAKSASVHKSAVLEGAVVLEEGVKVLPHATIRGPAWISAHAVIGTGSLVRGSSIGPHSVVGFATEVKGSILGSNVWTHMSYVGDSIISDNVAFGGGCVTGNFRLDEEEILAQDGNERIGTGLTKLGAMVGSGTRLGIQVGINPGVRIGSGSFIGGDSFIDRNIPDGSFVTMKNGEVLVRENKVSTKNPEEREKYRKEAKIM